MQSLIEAMLINFLQKVDLPFQIILLTKMKSDELAALILI